MFAWRPNAPHPRLIPLAAHEELVVPPGPATASERTFSKSDVFGCFVVVLPHGDKPFWEEEEQGVVKVLLLADERVAFEEIVVVVPRGE